MIRLPSVVIMGNPSFHCMEEASCISGRLTADDEVEIQVNSLLWREAVEISISRCYFRAKHNIRIFDKIEAKCYNCVSNIISEKYLKQTAFTFSVREE